MLDAALAEAAAAAGVGLTVEDNALFLSYEPE
jgi:hydrogenase maturation factor